MQKTQGSRKIRLSVYFKSIKKYQKASLGFQKVYLSDIVERHKVRNKAELDELVDIRDVVIDQDAPKEEKIKSFMRQIRNPYCFKVGNVVVKTTFADTDATLDDRLEHYLRNK